MARNRNAQNEETATVDETYVDGSGEGGAESAESKAKRGFTGEAVTAGLPEGFTLPEPDVSARSNNNPITAAVRAAKDSFGVWQATHVKADDVEQARQHLRSSANRVGVGVHIHPALSDSDQIDGGKAIFWHTKEKATRPRKAVADGSAETSPESAPVESADSPSYV